MSSADLPSDPLTVLILGILGGRFAQKADP